MKKLPTELTKHRLAIASGTACRELVVAIQSARLAPGALLTPDLLLQLGASGFPGRQELGDLIECGLIEDAGDAFKVAPAGMSSIVHFLASARDRLEIR